MPKVEVITEKKVRYGGKEYARGETFDIAEGPYADRDVDVLASKLRYVKVVENHPPRRGRPTNAEREARAAAQQERTVEASEPAPVDVPFSVPSDRPATGEQTPVQPMTTGDMPTRRGAYRRRDLKAE